MDFDLEYDYNYDERRKEKWSLNVLVNPSLSDLEALTRKSQYGECRGFLHDGSCYWWDSYIATHNDFVRWNTVDMTRPGGEVESYLHEDGTTVSVTATIDSDYDELVKMGYVPSSVG